jgi:hypothetical protein
MLSLLATSLLFISADLAESRRGGRWRARHREGGMGEKIGNTEGAENFTLQSFADGSRPTLMII